MSRYALVGADGMLGRTFREVLAARGIAFDAFTRRELDVTDAASIDARLRPEHTVILNCTAYTDVDRAEIDEANAFAVNGDAVRMLAARARANGSLLVHFSTDYVFDGSAHAPYAVDHPRAPINAYGRSKAAGEAFLEESGAAYLLVRTSWLYAPWSKNFVRTIAEAARTRPSLRVVDDQRGRPTSTATLAEATLDLVARGARGTFHVCDSGECTWYGLACAIGARVAPKTPIEPCMTAEFPRPAPRPRYSVLDLGKTEAALGRPLPEWRASLDAVLARLS